MSRTPVRPATGADHASTRPPSSAPHPAPEDLRPLHGSFWRALNEEVKATRRQDKKQAIPVGAGGRPSHVSSRTVYRFPTKAAPNEFSAGDRVVCRLGNQEVEGVVVKAGSTLVLDLECDLGATTPPGRVRPDTAWLTEAIRDRVASTIRAFQEGRAPEPPFHFEMALRALGRRSPGPGQADAPSEVWSGSPTLNAEQRKAVRQAIGSGVTYLWGPPGTGKSSTLARIIEAHYRRGDTVLAVAASNQAVDLLAQKTAARLPDGRLADGDVMRVGSGVTDQFPDRLKRIARPRPLAQLIRHSRLDRGPVTRRWWQQGPGTTSPTPPLARTGPVASLPGPADLRAEARIVVTTAHQVILEPSITRLYDAVVVDEASMLDLPTVYLMAGQAKAHVTLAGDFLQLPAVQVSKNEEGVLGRDVFQEVGIPDQIDRDERPDALVSLRTQYRMREPICKTASRLFYGDELTTAPVVQDRCPPDTPLNGCLFVVDTGGVGASAKRTSGGSRMNPIHASVDEALIDYLRIGPDERPDPDVATTAVLTPFVAQRRLVERRIRRRYPSDQVPISTIHGAQGDQFPVVVLDLVDALGPRLSRYMRASRLTDTGARLLNVGLTRASEQLIVVADVVHLSRHGGTVVQRLMQSLDHRATSLKPRRILRGSPTVSI